MNNSITYKIDPFLVLLSFILFLLSVKGILYNSVYLIFSILLALYFFPMKLFTKQWKEQINGKRIALLLLYILISIILGLSVVLLFFKESMFFNIMIILSIINIALAYYYAIKKFPAYLFVMHFSISLLTSAIIFI